MSARTKLDRLSAARPAVLDHTERVVDAEQERLILSQILSSPRRAGTTIVAPAGRGRSPRPGTVIAAATAAATAAAGVLIAVGAFHSGPAAGTAGAVGRADAAAGQARVISARTLADRTTAAVSQSSRKDIFYSRTVYAAGIVQGGTAALEEWDYGISVREKLFNAQGALTDDASAVVRHGLRERRFVFYGQRTWQADSIRADHYGAGASVRSMVGELLHRGKPGTPSRIRTAITPMIANGRQLFKITFSAGPDQGGLATLPQFTSSLEYPADSISQSYTETVWIDQATYLPVRVTLTGGDGRVLAAQTFAWLAPSQASLAELTPAPVPPGFVNQNEPAH